uniref:Phage tail assembly chaperone n=1 Tax=Candidatus Kentrum sp. FM TaxID=2126340 RepID=A0A450VLP0_9GAMM|nr:MAG: Phage tail assembly chaperone [Candidatus Kentron sp. FM]VFJ43669.1 MAG: Phage tail assembly chaperone [Candidatus Kentron sp. FM]VFK05661.1 MAG: Phage tail assembly chaperone [Candidatus Kentron sp. FM]
MKPDQLKTSITLEFTVPEDLDHPHAGETMTFNIEFRAADFNRYLQKMSGNNGLSAARNFLTMHVTQKDRAALREILDLPAAPLTLIGALMEEHVPELNAKAKKSLPSSPDSAKTSSDNS